MSAFLYSPLKDHVRIVGTHKAALARLGVETVRDLLYHFPVTYNELSGATTVSSLTPDSSVTLYGTIHRLESKKSWTTKKSMATAVLKDHSGQINLQWFSQPYIAKMHQEGDMVKISGTVTYYKDKPQITNPVIEKIAKLPEVTNALFLGEESSSSFAPKYRETKGISSTWIYHALKKIFSLPQFKEIEDFLPEDIRKKYSLPDIQSSCIWLHTPNSIKHAEVAQKRFAFEEMFYLQVKLQKERSMIENSPYFKIPQSHEKAAEFLKKLPFKLTGAQERVIQEITDDMKSSIAMSRLVEGDVGSGKTVVAAATAYAICKTNPDNQTFGGLQVAYMAPTEILAKQHFESFIEFFEGTAIKIALITGKGSYIYPSKSTPGKPTKISRNQLQKWVEQGEISMIIGTHALISEKVAFKDLAYVIIDEQHRFGTRQRQKLTSKSSRIPHLLSMTATPIPRTLALTIYGDLDISIIDEVPPGRQKVETKIVTPKDQKGTFVATEDLLRQGQQAYIICPRIFKPDEETATDAQRKLASVEEVQEYFQKDVFPDYTIGQLHGKMTPPEKDRILQDFLDKKIDVLVSTSVIEVGINIPNSSSIIIYNADRFGLSQLHQLRGRVQRGEHKPFCYLFTETKSERSLERLAHIEKSSDGFALAEADLSLRGTGDLAGNKQWGMSDLAMMALTNISLVEAAQKEAREIIKKNKSLKNFPHILKTIETEKEVHME